MSSTTNPPIEPNSPKPRQWYQFSLLELMAFSLAAAVIFASRVPHEQDRILRDRMAAMQSEIKTRELEVAKHAYELVQREEKLKKRLDETNTYQAEFLKEREALQNLSRHTEFTYNHCRILPMLDLTKPRHREAVQMLQQIDQRFLQRNNVTGSSRQITNDGYYVMIFQANQDGTNKPSGSVVALVQNGEIADLLVRPAESGPEKWHMVKLRNESKRLESFASSDDSSHTLIYETYHDERKRFIVSYRVTANGFDEIED